MTVDNVGTKNKPLVKLNIRAWSLLHFFSWCKPNWSHNEVNGWSHVLKEQRKTSWSMMKNNPSVMHLLMIKACKWGLCKHGHHFLYKGWRIFGNVWDPMNNWFHFVGSGLIQVFHASCVSCCEAHNGGLPRALKSLTTSSKFGQENTQVHWVGCFWQFVGSTRGGEEEFVCNFQCG